MPSSAASASYSWDDFIALDDDDPRELIDGELVEVEVPTFVHQHIVPENWIVDPQARTLERLVLRDGVFSITDSLADEETFRPEGFPGLEIPLARLWG